MGIDDLIKLVDTLRGENGCPWDRKQTPRTISTYLTEEIYELVDAVESGSPDDVCEELGDVLFHVLFIARIFQETGHFDIRDVARAITEKMIRRHPHVFGNDRVESTDEVRDRWREIKKHEKKLGKGESILDSVPVALPALMRAYRISERAAGTGFDWNDMSGVMQKVEEEWSEFQSRLAEENETDGNRDALATEFGDILFTLVNVARFASLNPETALTASVKKFEQRFRAMEKALSATGQTMESLSAKEMDDLWEAAKKTLDS